MGKKKGKKSKKKIKSEDDHVAAATETTGATASTATIKNEEATMSAEEVKGEIKSEPRTGPEETTMPSLQPTSNRTPVISQFSSWSQAFQAAASIKPHDLGEDYVDPDTTNEGGEKKVPYGSGNVFGVSQIAVECLTSGEKKQEEEKEEGREEAYLKKRNQEDAMMEETDEETDKGGENDSMKPLKKKKKKRRKKEKSKEQEQQDENTDHDNGQEDDQQLEGKMITHENQSIMVLIDWVKKVIYSGLDRSENGDRIPIGHVNDDDEIIITDTRMKPIKMDEEDVGSPEFPFDTDPDDHCESPLTAYQDLQPILNKLVEILGKKSKERLKIYDPYFCNGSVIEHLKSLGYTKVHNKKEDCYKVWSTESETKSKYPKYDVFITNPPYSSDHVEKLIHHLTTDDRTKRKPWCLLMPTYVHKKEYYKDTIASKKKGNNGIQPFYLVPKKRYVYLPPKNFREKKASDVHKKSSPFVSMWYIWGGTSERTNELVQAYKHWERQNNDYRCDLARGKSALRDLRRRNK